MSDDVFCKVNNIIISALAKDRVATTYYLSFLPIPTPTLCVRSHSDNIQDRRPDEIYPKVILEARLVPVLTHSNNLDVLQLLRICSVGSRSMSLSRTT